MNPGDIVRLRPNQNSAIPTSREHAMVINRQDGRVVLVWSVDPYQTPWIMRPEELERVLSSEQIEAL